MMGPEYPKILKFVNQETKDKPKDTISVFGPPPYVTQFYTGIRMTSCQPVTRRSRTDSRVCRVSSA
jgi:hypothetical protein